MTSGDDDWETAEVQLRGVQLDTPKTAVVIAPRVEQPAIPERDVAIDEALVSAWNNPRERMIVLQIEDCILNFVRALSEKAMDFPSGMNSFRRMVVYRIADRFGLQAEQINLDFNEKSLRLLKTSNMCIPRPLLIDYQGQTTDAVPQAASIAAGGSSPSVPTTSEVPTESSSKKVLLMKRKPAEVSSASSKTQSAKPQLSAEDREKAYLEARARIFGEAATGSDQSTPTTSSPSPKPTTTTSSDNLAAIGEASAGNTSRKSGADKVPALSSSSGKISPVNSSSNTQNTRRAGGGGGGSGKYSNNTRAQVRDAEAERADPDFVRRSNNGSSSGGGGMNGSNRRPPSSGAYDSTATGRYPVAGNYLPYGQSPAYNDQVNYNPQVAWQSSAVGPGYYGGTVPPPPTLTTPTTSGASFNNPYGGSGSTSPMYYGAPSNGNSYGYDGTYAGGGYYPPPQMSASSTYPANTANSNPSGPASNADFPPLR